MDWEDGVDKINMSNLNITASDVSTNTDGSGNEQIIYQSSSITFYGITTTLTTDDIIFV